MLLTIKAKLITTEEQERSLLQTMEKFNEACDYISEFAFRNKVFGKTKLQENIYYTVRQNFKLSAQMAIRAIAKVAESYKKDKKVQREFKKYGAIIYDQRILSYRNAETISILTLDGRTNIKMRYGEYRKFDYKKVRGQSDLIYKNGVFYLLIVIEQSEEDIIRTTEKMGVDLGRVNIAVTSDGKVYSGQKCKDTRKKYSKIKAILQKAGTWDAKKHLKRISGRERRFKRDVNHCISKELVQNAKDTNRSIVLEELTGIRERTTVSYKKISKENKKEKYIAKNTNDDKSKWAFGELRFFTEYKAKIAGVPVDIVDPAYTSQMCSVCGHVSNENRKTQADFVCCVCGHSENADFNAAKNIAYSAIVKTPITLCSVLTLFDCLKKGSVSLTSLVDNAPDLRAVVNPPIALCLGN
jgi:putative transposase